MDWEGEVRDNPDDPTPIPHRGGEEGEENKERCVICLMALRDRTIVGVCGHEFCVGLLFLSTLICRPLSSYSVEIK
jgi:E3 ubiquitin-protein ligase Topors